MFSVAFLVKTVGTHWKSMHVVKIRLFEMQLSEITIIKRKGLHLILPLGRDKKGGGGGRKKETRAQNRSLKKEDRDEIDSCRGMVKALTGLTGYRDSCKGKQENVSYDKVVHFLGYKQL